MTDSPNPVAMSAYLKDFVRAGVPITAIDYFTYNANVSAVAANTPTKLLIQTQADSDFVMTNLSGASQTAGTAPTPRFPATVQFTDRGTGKTFFNQPALLEQVCGLGGFSFVLPTPRVLGPNTNIIIDLVSLVGASTAFWFSLIGARIYYATPAAAVSAGIPQ